MICTPCEIPDHDATTCADQDKPTIQRTCTCRHSRPDSVPSPYWSQTATAAASTCKTVQDHLGRVTDTAEQLWARTQHLEDQVTAARSAGASWDEIAKATAMTREAAEATWGTRPHRASAGVHTSS